jgi:hypothetical protein|eukprot:COSAG01_NODE_5490_length_4227_cov_430.424661_3_plen_57_part_00
MGLLAWARRQDETLFSRILGGKKWRLREEAKGALPKAGDDWPGFSETSLRQPWPGE